jgi:MSHA biogenesis protein MshL
LDVTPSIDENGAVILHVHPSVSNVTQKNLLVNLGTLGNFTLPLASSAVSETDTVVGVHDGNIVAIGGLMKVNAQDSNNGLPGMADLPGVGYLFSSKSKSLTKQELVILIKPTIVRPDSSTQAERDDLKAALERDFSATH